MKSFLRKYLNNGAVIIAGGMYVWALIILLENDNWVGISALTTMLLGIAAFWAIWDSREREKRDRKERLLNEIIEWATDIVKFSPMPKQTIFELKLQKEEPDIKDVIMLWQVSLQELLLPIISKGAYINRVSKNLGKNVWSATNKASYYLGNITEYINKLDNTYSSFDALKKSNEELRNAAVEVIEEATKIKTKDIGKKEENMSKEGEDTGGNEPTLKDIEGHLKDIKRNGRIADTKWSISFVITVWVIASNWLTDNVPSNNPLAWVIVALGLLLLLWTLYTPLISRLWQRTRSKSRK